MTWVAATVVLAGFAIVLSAIAAQAFWVARALAGVEEQLRELRGDVKSLRDEVVREHGERIARLEERTST